MTDVRAVSRAAAKVKQTRDKAVPGGRAAYNMSIVRTVDGADTVTLEDGSDEGRPVAYLGNPWDYHPGMRVCWIDEAGAPLVVGPDPGMGASVENGTLPDWTTPLLGNSWVDYGSGYAAARYYQQPDGWTRLSGLIKSGTDSATMFVVPDPPPFNCYFNVNSNNTTAILAVGTNGSVSKLSGGNNTFVSLDNVVFPHDWNHRAWQIAALQGTWDHEDGFSEGPPEVYVRDDGWCWWHGAFKAGTVNTAALLLPQDARVYRYHQMHPVASYTVAGVVNLVTNNRGYLLPTSAQTVPYMLGGVNYFGHRAADDQFATFTPSNGWSVFGSMYQPPGYTKDRYGVVHLRGLVQATGKTSNVITTLPAGYRPSATLVFNAIGGSGNGTQSRIDITSSGAVTWISGSATGFLSLNQISFRAEL
jgi:hypothetical protein